MAQPYRVEEEWSRVVFGRRTTAAAEFFLPRLRPGMSLIDCGCGPGSITVGLAAALAPGAVVGVDVHAEALEQGRQLAAEQGVTNVTFQEADVHRLPFPDGSFDAAWACAVIQHLATPVEALREIRRVLKPDGVVGVLDGSSPVTFRYPTNPLLELWDNLRGHDPDRPRPPTALELRRLLREAGFRETAGSAQMAQEAGPPAGTIKDTRRVAQNHLIQLRGLRGQLAVERGRITEAQREQIAEAIVAWGDHPDAIYTRPVFSAIGWA